MKREVPPNPMIFRLENPATGTAAFAGVLDFTAAEGAVALPSSLVEALGADPGHHLRVKLAVDVPKATHVKLQPLTADFLDLPDHKRVLERWLTSARATLSEQEIVTVVHEDDEEYGAIVVETKPAKTVCVVNTDCAVEFAPPLNAGRADSRQAAAGLALGKAASLCVRHRSTTRPLNSRPLCAQ